jgi:D-glycero-D-manno-heptose 1,7-bisphosphate phosphatase
MCRKPDSVMLEKLLAKYSLNKQECWFIGDSQSDTEAAVKAGIQSIKIQSNSNMYPYISNLI